MRSVVSGLSATGVMVLGSTGQAQQYPIRVVNSRLQIFLRRPFDGQFIRYCLRKRRSSATQIVILIWRS